MTSNDPQHAYEIFTAALRLSAEERDAFVRSGARDEEERALVEGLLAADSINARMMPPRLNLDASDVLSQVKSQAAKINEPDLAGRRLGAYQLQSELGRGGMGIVYLAVQESTQQTVALKCLRAGISTPKLVRRFAQEARVLGRLDHPGIARIFDAGTFDDEGGGMHYFAMEYVRGQTLAEYARTTELDLRDKLKLLAAIGTAVHHAHENGIVHRDLKPANILVTPDGDPKVLDFGVSRVVDRDLQLTTVGTEAGRLIGTLSYMSPEQAGGDQRDVTPASDIYALGVILYELISGKLPHDLGDATFLSAARIIRDDKPRSLAILAPGLPRDVATMIGKAMEREPGRRYASASDFADDLERFLRHEPILARAPSALYTVSRFVRRHRVLAASTATIVLVLAAATAFSMRWAMDAESAREIADWSGYRTQLELSESALRDGHLASAQSGLRRVPDSMRDWEWRYLWKRADQSLRTFTGHTVLVWSVAFSGDGRIVYSTSGDNTLRSWDVNSGRELGRSTDHNERVFSVDVSPDGQFLASGADEVHLRDATTLETLAVIGGHTGTIHGLKFSPDGSVLASGDSKGGLQLSDGRDGHLLRALAGHTSFVWEFAFSPTSERVAVSYGDGTIELWRAANGEQVTQIVIPGGGAHGMDFAPDGRHVAVGSRDGHLRLLDPETLEIVLDAPAHADAIHDVIYTHDSAWLITASADHTIGIFDARSLEQLGRLTGHTDVVVSLAFDPGTRTLISGSWDQALRSWDAAALERRSLRYPLRGAVAFAPGTSAASYCTLASSGTLLVHNTETGAVISEHPRPGPLANAIEHLLPRSNLLSYTSLVDGSSRPSPPTLRRIDGSLQALGTKPASGGGFAGDGSVVWLSNDEFLIDLFDARSGASRGQLSDLAGWCGSLQMDSEQQWIAAGDCGDFTVKVWDAQTLRPLAAMGGHANDIISLAFSPTGRWLLSSSNDASTIVWNTRDWSREATLIGHAGAHVYARFHPEERRVASVSNDGFVRFWSTQTWDQVLAVQLPENSGMARGLHFSPDGDQLFVSMESGVHLLDCR